MKQRAYGPRTTFHLQTQWRALMTAPGARTHLASATRFAVSTGARPGTGRWYAAALWSYNQH